MRKHFTVRSNRNSQPINTGILLPFMSGGIILTSFSSNHAARTNKSSGKSDLAKTKPRLLLFNAAFLFQRAIFHLCEYLFKVVLDELALYGGAGSIYGRPDFVRGLQNCCGWPRHDWSLRLSKIPHPGIAHWFFEVVVRLLSHVDVDVISDLVLAHLRSLLRYESEQRMGNNTRTV
jgi:hypothetical protein